MRIEGNLKEGTLLYRETRFSALVKINEESSRCFLPNPGRMKELLFPGAEILLHESVPGERKTKYTIIGIKLEGHWISVDSRIPNKLILEALKEGKIREFHQYTIIKPEYRLGHNRIDFFLSNEESCLLEVKSCTLVRDRTALFPDAPTERGRRHLIELINARTRGFRAAVLFLVQRTDVDFFAPNDETDPVFGQKLRDASRNDVEIYSYTSQFIDREIVLKDKIEVRL